jgi:hypothetical protein
MAIELHVTERDRGVGRIGKRNGGIAMQERAPVERDGASATWDGGMEMGVG